LLDRPRSRKPVCLLAGVGVVSLAIADGIAVSSQIAETTAGCDGA
jgi:hypothetical protein